MEFPAITKAHLIRSGQFICRFGYCVCVSMYLCTLYNVHGSNSSNLNLQPRHLGIVGHRFCSRNEKMRKSKFFALKSVSVFGGFVVFTQFFENFLLSHTNHT